MPAGLTPIDTQIDVRELLIERCKREPNWNWVPDQAEVRFRRLRAPLGDDIRKRLGLTA